MGRTKLNTIIVDFLWSCCSMSPKKKWTNSWNWPGNNRQIMMELKRWTSVFLSFFFEQMYLKTMDPKLSLITDMLSPNFNKAFLRWIISKSFFSRTPQPSKEKPSYSRVSTAAGSDHESDAESTGYEDYDDQVINFYFVISFTLFCINYLEFSDWF